jgi:hypothetical protein
MADSQVEAVNRMLETCGQSPIRPPLDGVDWAWRALDCLAHKGVGSIIKVDHARPEQPYTVVLSGPGVPDGFVRRDSNDVTEALLSALAELESRGLSGRSS